MNSVQDRRDPLRLHETVSPWTEATVAIVSWLVRRKNSSPSHNNPLATTSPAARRTIGAALEMPLITASAGGTVSSRFVWDGLIP